MIQFSNIDAVVIMNAQRLRLNLAIIAQLERMWMGTDDGRFIDSELLGTWLDMLYQRDHGLGYPENIILHCNRRRAKPCQPRT
jgi:hypothetical protein